MDPDDHHLAVSPGCAAENLVQAARAHGLRAEVIQEGDGAGIHIELEPTRPHATELFQAVPARQNTRAEYDGRSIAPEDLRQLERAAAQDGVEVLLLTDRRAMNEVLDLIIQATVAHLNDPPWVDELKAWTRFGCGPEMPRSLRRPLERVIA